MLVGGVVQHQFNDDANVALMSCIKEGFEIVECPVAGMDGIVVGDVVAVVAQRRWEERHEPERVNAELLQVVEPLRQANEVADAVSIAVLKRSNVHLVYDGVSVPKGVGFRGQDDFIS